MNVPWENSICSLVAALAFWCFVFLIGLYALTPVTAGPFWHVTAEKSKALLVNKSFKIGNP